MGNNITSTPSQENEEAPDLRPRPHVTGERRRNAVPTSSVPNDDGEGVGHSSHLSGSLLASTPSSGGATAHGLHHRAISSLLSDGSGSGGGGGVFALTPEMVRSFVLKATLRGRNKTYIRQITNPPDPSESEEEREEDNRLEDATGERSGNTVDEAERVMRLKLQSVVGRYAALFAKIRRSDSPDVTDGNSELTALAQVLSHADRMWSEILSPSGVMDVQKGVRMVRLFREAGEPTVGVLDVVVSDSSDDDDVVCLVGPDLGDADVSSGWNEGQETEEVKAEVPVSECVRFGLIHFLGEAGSATVTSSLRLVPALLVSNLLLSFGPSSICWPLVLTSEDEPRGPFEIRIKDIVFCTIPISPIPGLMVSEGFWKGLCQEIVRWNSEILFESKEYAGTVANSMAFVRSVLGCADVPVDAAFLPTSPLGMLTAWYDENPATCLCFIPDETFMEHYGLRKDIYRFKTHAQLDEFVGALVEADDYSLSRRFAEERSLLCAFDRGFWSQRAIRDVAIFAPRIHEEQMCCPFRT